MSDWEKVDSADVAPPESQSSDWEKVDAPAPSQQQTPNESMGASVLKAPFRIGEDLYRGAGAAIKGLPDALRQGRSELSGITDTMQAHPGHLLGQAGAGLAELGENLFNSPHDLANYATNRLNLIPQDVNQKIQMGRMPADTGNMIDKTFGTPDFPGEKLTRGTMRNALNIIGAGSVANAINPMNLTAKSIANDVVKTEKRQVGLHNDAYNNIWNQAEKTGFNQVPVDTNQLKNNLAIISKYKTPREYQSLKNMVNDPTLQNGQKSLSDLKNIVRGLDEKSRTSSLTSEEKAMHEAATDSIEHISNNMFKNSRGDTNNSLQKKFAEVNNSYRENVVPYKYNSAIQAYKNKEMLPHELVNSLSRGEFAAKKGGAHPAMKMRNALSPTLATLGAGAGAKWLYDEMMGTKSPPH